MFIVIVEWLVSLCICSMHRAEGVKYFHNVRRTLYTVLVQSAGVQVLATTNRYTVCIRNTYEYDTVVPRINVESITYLQVKLDYCYCIKQYSGVTMTQNQRHSISLCSSNSLSVLSCTQKLSCDTGTVSLPLLSSKGRLKVGGTLEFGMVSPRLFATGRYIWYTRLEDLRASRLSYSLLSYFKRVVRCSCGIRLHLVFRGLQSLALTF